MVICITVSRYVISMEYVNIFIIQMHGATNEGFPQVPQLTLEWMDYNQSLFLIDLGNIAIFTT